MKKRIYKKPELISEAFVPQSYVAACAWDEVEWRGKCDMTGYVFWDSNNNGTYDAGIDKYASTNTACPDWYITKIKPTQNAFIFAEVTGKGTFSSPYKGKGTGTRGYRFEEPGDTHFTANLNSIKEKRTS